MNIDRDRAADLGVSVSDLADTLRMLVAGVKMSAFAERGEEYDIRLRAAPAYRRDVSGIARMTVASRKYGTLPLTNVVHTSEASGPSQVNRLGRRRQVTFMANVVPGYAESDVVKAFQSAFAKQHVSAEYRSFRPGAPSRHPSSARASRSRSRCPSCSCI